MHLHAKIYAYVQWNNFTLGTFLFATEYAH